jgi:hypothetical protein
VSRRGLDSAHTHVSKESKADASAALNVCFPLPNTVHAIDVRGVEQVLMKHSDLVAKAVRKGVRHFSPYLRP